MDHVPARIARRLPLTPRRVEEVLDECPLGVVQFVIDAIGVILTAASVRFYGTNGSVRAAEFIHRL